MDGGKDVFCRFGCSRSDYIRSGIRSGCRGQDPQVREARFGTRSQCCRVAIGRSSWWTGHFDLGKIRRDRGRWESKHTSVVAGPATEVAHL